VRNTLHILLGASSMSAGAHVLAGRHVTHSSVHCVASSNTPAILRTAVIHRYVDCVNGGSKSCSKSAATQSTTTLIQHGRMHQVTYGY
jgi:hypothetical protein